MSGLNHKFNVSRVDGRDAPGGDREGTRYFVLDPANDPFARKALMTYAVECALEEPELSVDLVGWLMTL